MIRRNFNGFSDVNKRKIYSTNGQDSLVEATTIWIRLPVHGIIEFNYISLKNGGNSKWNIPVGRGGRFGYGRTLY
jgi:hypothetical protein